ncbi:MAG: hypothetical protein PVH61_17655 [Candidatus Aminicenantes bacterium]|jgi:diaminopimelate decarboxylase
MKRTEELVKKQFQIENHQLKIGAFTVDQIVGTYGTPVYVYDARGIIQTYHSITGHLPGGVEIFYSIKANPSLAICQLLRHLGAGAEIASLGELNLALKAGFPPNRIVFAGPGKTPGELEAAIQNNILMINVESLQELETIVNICQASGLTANVGIRINPAVNVTNSQMSMGGGSQKFGIDESQLEEAVRYTLTHHRYLLFKGFHLYVGTQIFDHQGILENFKNMIRIVREVMSRFPHVPVGIIDFGAGFGIPYYKKETDFNLHGFLTGFAPIMTAVRQEPIFKKTHFIFEMGRYLTARSGIYLSRVLYSKTSGDRCHVILDGGMHHNAVGTGNMGQRIPKKFPLCVANKLGLPLTQKANIAGPLCTPLDSFGRDFEVPEIQPGDIVAVLQMGAYGLTASMNHFLSHPICGEVMIDGELSQWIREPTKPGDIFQGQHLFSRI